jgi:hypothetical protein
MLSELTNTNRKAALRELSKETGHNNIKMRQYSPLCQHNCNIPARNLGVSFSPCRGCVEDLSSARTLAQRRTWFKTRPQFLGPSPHQYPLSSAAVHTQTLQLRKGRTPARATIVIYWPRIRHVEDDGLLLSAPMLQTLSSITPGVARWLDIYQTVKSERAVGSARDP